MVVDDYMPQVLWKTYFIEYQGKKIDDAIIYQYEKSSMLLEKTGTLFSSNFNKNINVR